MKRRFDSRLACVAMLVVAASAGAADPARLTRAEPLREKPFADAKVLAQLPSGSKVDVLKREGGWYKVGSGSRTGWVRMLGVRRSTAASTTVQGLAGVASGRAGTGQVVGTTGVRGLDAEALAEARFDESRIAAAERHRVSKSDAGAWAAKAHLVTRDVPLLPAPKSR